MNSRIKFAMVQILFVFLPLLYAAETIYVPENSLLFQGENDNRNWTFKAIVKKGFDCEVSKTEKVFLYQREDVGYCVDVYHLKIPGAAGLSYFPEVTFQKKKDGNFQPQVDKIDSLMFLGILLFAAGLAALAGYFRREPEKNKYLLPAALVFFFWGFASWYIGFISNSIITPFDDIHYFNIARQLLALDFSSVKYYYTIGFPILCIPFVVLFHLQHWIDFVAVYMYFQTFILIPGLFLVLYWFFQTKMGLSRLQSFSVLLLWLLLMIFYMPMCGSADLSAEYIAANYYGNASFCLPERNDFFPFFHLTWLGRNAMCDYMTVFLLVILLAASMKKSRSLIRFFVLSMGFGFICLVRINYIFFAPLLAFVFYDSFSELWKNKRNYLYAFLCGSAGFMLVFVWQFVVNKIQFGSPLVWPYSLHEFAPDRGFVWNVVPYGFKYLCQTNYVYLILGISSLLFLPERKTRALLTLWIFPLLFFFCGYPVVFNSPIRFIFAIYAPLLAAAVMNPVWKAAWSVRIKAALVVLSSCLLCKSNVFFIYFQPWNLEKIGWPNTVFMITQGVVCLFCCAVIFSMRKELEADYANTIRHFRFLLIFTSVFFLGSVCIYISAILILAAFVYGLRDTWTAIREIAGKTSLQNGPAADTAQ